MKFQFKKLKWQQLAVFILSVGLLFVAWHFAYAQAPVAPATTTAIDPKQSKILDFIGSMLSMIVYYLFAALGWIMDLILSVMMFVGRYNNFSGVTAVNYGWKVVRDLCNNFFIIMLLFSAVGTVLQRETYMYNKIMPRLLAMAVMINFSRLMTLLLIDFSQVIMMTFGAQIMGMTGKAILLTAINMPGNLNFSAGAFKLDSASLIGVLAAIVFGLIVAIVAVVVITCITIVLAYRIVMLFFLIILSPIAFAGSVFDKTKQMANEWWTELGKNLMIGPIMMFFLYISFYIIANLNTPDPSGNGINENLKAIDSTGQDKTITAQDPNAAKGVADTGVGFSAMGQPANVFNMMIAIGMLVGTLVLSQKFAGAGGKFLGAGVAKLKGMGKATVGKMADVSGVSTVSGAATQYFKQRSAQKAELKQGRIDSLTAQTQNVVGHAKRAATYIPNALGNQIRTKGWDRLTGKRKSDDLAKQLKQDNEKLKEEKVKIANVKNSGDIESGREFTHEGVSYAKDATSGKWTADNGSGHVVPGIDQKDLVNRMSTGSNANHITYGSPISHNGKAYTKEAAGWLGDDGKLLSEQQLAKELGGINSQEATALQSSVDTKTKDKERTDRRQKWTNRAGKAALFAGGAAAGMATGGFGFVPAIVGALAGGKMIPGMAEAAKNAGKGDLKLSAAYVPSQVKKERDKAKDLSNEEVLMTMDDQSKNKFTRVASALEAMSRGLLSREDAEKRRFQILDQMFKGGKMGNEYSHKKMNGEIEAILEKKYPGLTTTFRTANADTSKLTGKALAEAVSKADKAKKEIQGGFADGTYTMKDMDDDSIAKNIGAIAIGIKTGTFAKQFADFSATKQEALVRALEKHATKESKEKLATVKSVERAYGKGAMADTNSDLKNFLKNMNAEGYNKMINGTSEQFQSLKTAVNGKADNLSEAIRDNGGRTAQQIKVSLKVT